jgi:nitrogen fixation NifU-like protein
MAQTDLYDDVIMDHIRNARNYGAPEHVQRKATGFNPLCGDEMTLYLGIRNGLIEDIAFQCTCCGISMASASIMTELLKGRELDGAREQVRAFVALLDDRAHPVQPNPTQEQEALLATARKYPSRVRCATLPWSTLARILEELANA